MKIYPLKFCLIALEIKKGVAKDNSLYYKIFAGLQLTNRSSTLF